MSWVRQRECKSITIKVRSEVKNVNIKTECLTHRKEAVITTLCSGTIKGTVEKWLGVKRTNGA